MIPAHDRIAIVASGPSLQGVDLRPLCGVHVIVVNVSVTWSPVAHSFFSLDPSPNIIALFQKRRVGVDYYMAVPEKWTGLRHSDVTYLLRINGHGTRGAAHKLSEDARSINNGNSAYGALGLAYHMQPKKILLLGVDATDQGYAYVPGSPAWSLGHLPALFASAVPQLSQRNIAVLNGSPGSLVTCFPRTTAKDAIEWILTE